MSTQIQPGDIVQNAITGSKVIYEVVRIDGDYARVRPLWGASEHTEKVGHLERMCDEQVTGLAQWRANAAYAAMGGVKKISVQATTQLFRPGDEVRCIDFSRQRGDPLAFLKSKSVHTVMHVDSVNSVELLGGARFGRFRGDRFELVTAGAITAAAQPVTVPDALFGVGEVIEYTSYDRTGSGYDQLATIKSSTWDSVGRQWLYFIELVGGQNAGCSAQLVEKYARKPKGEIEADEHKHHHHHHDGHKHVMGLDHDEIDPVAYREFMRSL